MFHQLCTSEENGIANEAIVLEWLFSSSLWDFKVVGFCVQTVIKESHNSEPIWKEEIRTYFGQFGYFLVWYFCNAFSHYCECCWLWKHLKVNVTLLWRLLYLRFWDFFIYYITQSLHIDPTRLMLKPTFLPNGALHMLRNTNWFHNSVVLLSTMHNQLLTVS